MQTVKKGFYVAAPLAKAWDAALTNKNDNSASAAGAMFVFMLLPAEVREMAKQFMKPEKLRTGSDLKAAQRAFKEAMRLPPEQLTYEVVQRALSAATNRLRTSDHSDEESGKSL